MGVINFLDDIADRLEIKGFVKEAHDLDVISNSLCRVGSAKISPVEENVLKFVKQHDPGKDAELFIDKNKVMIKMSNPWNKPGTKEEGVETLTFEATMPEAKKALGY